MALIVEDGTIVEDANSYVELADARAYALDRGVTLSSDDAVVSAFVIKAADYIEAFEDEFVGTLTDADQSLSFPRSGILKSDGTAYPTDQIPTDIKNAQCQLVIEQSNGIDIMPSFDSNDAKFIVREKVDVLETQYSDKFGQQFNPILPAVDALLKKWLRAVPVLRNIRV